MVEASREALETAIGHLETALTRPRMMIQDDTKVRLMTVDVGYARFALRDTEARSLLNPIVTRWRMNASDCSIVRFLRDDIVKVCSTFHAMLR